MESAPGAAPSELLSRRERVALSDDIYYIQWLDESLLADGMKSNELSFDFISSFGFTLFYVLTFTLHVCVFLRVCL